MCVCVCVCVKVDDFACEKTVCERCVLLKRCARACVCVCVCVKEMYVEEVRERVEEAGGRRGQGAAGGSAQLKTRTPHKDLGNKDPRSSF